jgi:hypothetical protein
VLQLRCGELLRRLQGHVFVLSKERLNVLT